MIARTLVVAALLAAVSASPCRPSHPGGPPPPTKTGGPPPPPTKTADPPAVTPTIPITGNVQPQLSLPDGLTLKAIAIGHGLQNYSCPDGAVSAGSAGALAVLYNVTGLYPGMPDGLSQAEWDGLSTKVLFGQNIPLRLQNPSAAPPGSPTTPNKAAESGYGAVVGNPFLPIAPLNIPGMRPIEFLGHHYFDSAGAPTFDLNAARPSAMLASVSKIDDIKAPTTADKGILETTAVDWLRLNDNGKGISKGVQSVYRVITAGGGSQSCADVGAATGSVPYTAFYWFYG